MVSGRIPGEIFFFSVKVGWVKVLLKWKFSIIIDITTLFHVLCNQLISVWSKKVNKQIFLILCPINSLHIVFDHSQTSNISWL